jgi:hypothetical protein
MNIYYAVVEGDPLDNGGGSRVVGGAQHATIEGPDGQMRGQTHLGHKAWCAVCQSFGSILVGAAVKQSLRGFDARLNAWEAVGGDIVICKCERHPRVMSVYARSVMYIDNGDATATYAQSAMQPGATYDEQVAACAPRVSLEGYPYLIETTDGQTLCGRVDSSGRLPRIYTDSAAIYTVHWGDEALAHKEWK